MNETNAKCIVASVWALKSYLGNDYNIKLYFETNSDDVVVIDVIKDWKIIFSHTWQNGDTIDSFLEALNVRVTSIFDLND